MIKLGKIKSWYIDPEDNRFTYTQHNILSRLIIFNPLNFFTCLSMVFSGMPN